MELLIVGASARAAAFSALRAGFRPTCVDLFADRDLAAACPVHRIDPADYPDGLYDLAERFKPGPWLYTGGLENHPDLVDRISIHHMLLGNAGAILRAVRDPVSLAEAFASEGLKAPRVGFDPASVPDDGSWLTKPRASAGGRAIKPFRGSPIPHVDRCYFQERIEGLSLSALYLGDAHRTRCVGVTRQLVGKPGNRFAYRGSLAPWPVHDEVMERVERIGRTVALNFGIKGIFGVDLILSEGHPWPIEVNPRYTASVETLEWAVGRAILAEHAGLFQQDIPVVAESFPAQGFVGKAIVHADRAFAWAEPFQSDFQPGRMPEVADIPVQGTEFQPGEPVLTVLARGDDPDECRRQLASRILEWRRRLWKSSS